MARDYEDILEEVLDRIPEEYDTREGSVLWLAVAPLCAEISQLEIKLENMSKEAYLGTATAENLDALARDFGFERKLAVPVTVKATLIGGSPQIGNKFSSIGLEEEIIYEVTESLGSNNYHLMATTVNEQANYYTGQIAMVDYINDLQSATITEIIIPQKPTETDEEFRTRIRENTISESADGNAQQYYKWLSEIDGVGKTKVIPLWNGVNTVKCTVLNELNTPASPEIVASVQTILDPNKEGLGMGKAPIGAIVTVDTATELKINIEASVTFKEGSTSAPTLKQELTDYFSSIALEKTVVSYYAIVGILVNNKDIETVTSLEANNGTVDIPIPSGQVPVLGTLVRK